MRDKYTKLQPKIHPLTYVAIVGFIIVFVGLILIFKPTDQELIYEAYEPYADQELFTMDHPFDSVQYKSTLFNKGLDKIINEEEIVMLYIGFSACPDCQAVIGAYQYYFEQYEMTTYVDQIYYLNATQHPNDVDTLIAKYPAITTTTPQLIVFKDGQMIKTYTQVAEGTNINLHVSNFYSSLVDLLEVE